MKNPQNECSVHHTTTLLRATSVLLRERKISRKKVLFQNHAFSRVRIEKFFCYFNHLMSLAYWFEKYTLEVTAIFSSVFTVFSNSVL